MSFLRRALGRCFRSLSLWLPLYRRGDAPLPPLPSVREILVIRLDEIGDFVLTSAFLRELRRNAPQARITLVVNPLVFPLAAHCPHVNAVLAFDNERSADPDWRIFAKRLRALWLRLTTFRRYKFELVLLPRRGPDFPAAQFLAHLWGGSAAIASCRDEVGMSFNPGNRPYFTSAHYFNNTQFEHEVHHTLRFLRWCGAETNSEELELWPAPADRAFAQDLLAKHFSRTRPLIVLHPSGGNSPLKQWPVKNFQALLAELQAELSVQCIVIGGKDEPWIGELFPSAAPASVLNLAGKLELAQLAALIAETDLFIGGDSGPMHIAAAAGIPVVAIFGSTSQVRFRPFSPAAEVVSLNFPCSPDVKGILTDRCYQCIYDHIRCLTEISVAMVSTRVSSRLLALGFRSKVGRAGSTS